MVWPGLKTESCRSRSDHLIFNGEQFRNRNPGVNCLTAKSRGLCYLAFFLPLPLLRSLPQPCLTLLLFCFLLLGLQSPPPHHLGFLHQLHHHHSHPQDTQFRLWVSFSSQSHSNPPPTPTPNSHSFTKILLYLEAQNSEQTSI